MQNGEALYHYLDGHWEHCMPGVERGEGEEVDEGFANRWLTGAKYDLTTIRHL